MIGAFYRVPSQNQGPWSHYLFLFLLSPDLFKVGHSTSTLHIGKWRLREVTQNVLGSPELSVWAGLGAHVLSATPPCFPGNNTESPPPPPSSAPLAAHQVRVRPQPGPGWPRAGSRWAGGGRTALKCSALRPEIKLPRAESSSCKSLLKEERFQVSSEPEDSHRHPTPPCCPPCCPRRACIAWEPRPWVLTASTPA